MSTIELKVTRDRFTLTSTTSVLLYDNLPFGYVLEDVDRGLDSADPSTWERKVKKQTAIPVGRYRVQVVWSPSREQFTPRLLDVPAFRGILIHPGNDHDDSEGCLLPGLRREVDRVVNSRRAYNWLFPRLRDADEVWITIGRDEAAWATAPFNPDRT